MSQLSSAQQRLRPVLAYVVAAPLLWLAFNYPFVLGWFGVSPLLITPALVAGACALFCLIRERVTAADGLAFLALVAVTSSMRLWPDVYLARLWQGETASQFIYLVTRVLAGLGAALTLYYFWALHRARASA